MLDQYLPYSLEIFVYIFFIIFVFGNFKIKNYELLKIWTLSFIFAVSFEFINMTISQTYSYIDYIWWYFWLPIYIPIARWLIFVHIYSFIKNDEQKYQQINWKFNYNIFLFAILWSFYALGIDLIVDVLAIRLNLWTWFLSFEQWRFGVSISNYIWRLIVSFFFLFFFLYFEYSHTKSKIWLYKKYFLTLMSSLFFQSLFLLWPIFIYEYFDQDFLAILWFMNQKTVPIYWFSIFICFVIFLNFIFLFNLNKNNNHDTKTNNLVFRILDWWFLFINIWWLFLCFYFWLNYIILINSFISTILYLFFFIKKYNYKKNNYINEWQNI